jgi:hypothetical protein
MSSRICIALPKEQDQDNVPRGAWNEALPSESNEILIALAGRHRSTAQSDAYAGASMDATLTSFLLTNS